MYTLSVVKPIVKSVDRKKKRKIDEWTDQQTRTGSRVVESKKKRDGVLASAVQVGGHR